jgi:hypothetical protein
MWAEGWIAMRRHDGGKVEVFRITGARTALAEDVRARQRRYVIAMLIRSLAVVLAIVLWDVERYVAVAALALGLLLPYVAVVIANGGRERPQALPETFVVAPWNAGVPLALPADGSAGPAGREASMPAAGEERASSR